MPTHYRIRKGLDLPIDGAPDQAITPGAGCREVALDGRDFNGLKPRMAVQAGDRVGIGQTLFVDRRDPAVAYTAPGAGEVVAVHRGPRRVLEAVVIRCDAATAAPDPHLDPQLDKAPAALAGEALAAALQRNGLWTAFRERPFERVPHSTSRPHTIFVTAIDTHPLAPDPLVVLAGGEARFLAGLELLRRLHDGPLALCTAPGFEQAVAPPEWIEHLTFSGPHPAGLPGTHMHLHRPVGEGRMHWHIGYQDVLALGRWAEDGQLDQRRVVALGGPLMSTPRLVETRIGASLSGLLDGEVTPAAGRYRVISGSVLGGRHAGGRTGFLGRYHRQVTVLGEAREARLLGWTWLGGFGYTTFGPLFRASGHRRPYRFTTARNGRFSGMLPMRVFERLVPLDILPSPLFRALLVQDTQRARDLGCLELAEEDLALCTFACPAKVDYGGALRHALRAIEKDG